MRQAGEDLGRERAAAGRMAAPHDHHELVLEKRRAREALAEAVASPAIRSAAAIVAAGTILVSLISVLRIEPVTDPTNGVYEPWLTPSLQLLTDA